MAARHRAPDVFASALGRIDILNGGFARLVFYTLDGEPIDPPLVLKIDAMTNAILSMTKAAALEVLGFREARSH